MGIHLKDVQSQEPVLIALLGPFSGRNQALKASPIPGVRCIADTNRVASVATGARLVTNCPVSYRVGLLLSIRKITLLGKMARPID
jgi:hypothetical protein